MKIKHMLIIPPDGEFRVQDFSIQRINRWLKQYQHIKITLLHINPSKFELDTSMFENVITVTSKEEIISTIKQMKYDVLFHRTWMTTYEFSAELVKEFKDIIINIKDWNAAPKDVYEFIYPGIKDYEGIEYIFKNAKLILSHFRDEQAIRWAKEYNTTSDKFVFFPEYCNEIFFHTKVQTKYESYYRLVYAGGVSPTSLPEDYFPGKSHIRSIKKITQQNIDIDFVLPENIYDITKKSTEVFKDYIFESEMNERFNLVKGKALDATILDKYHFGFFELESSGINTYLFKYIVTSKFAFYLEAGLPMLINDKFCAMADIVKEYNLGLVFNNDDLDDMNRFLDISQERYNSFIHNIKEYRKDYIYDDEKLKIMGLENEYIINSAKI